jgi:hypothetical protein
VVSIALPSHIIVLKYLQNDKFGIANACQYAMKMDKVYITFGETTVNTKTTFEKCKYDIENCIFYCFVSCNHRVHRVVRSASGVHSVMRVKLAWAGAGGGCTPTPFYYIYHHQ